MNLVVEEDVEFIRLQFTDIFGNLKNVAVTSSQLERALNNECMFDGSSIEGFTGIKGSHSASGLYSSAAAKGLCSLPKAQSSQP